MLLMLACAAEDLNTELVTGPEGEFEDDQGADTGDGDDTADTGDTSIEDTDQGHQICYPGADNSWTTCFELVQWSASWGADYDYPEPLEGSPLYRKPLRFLDLSQLDDSEPLAPNFTLGELMSAAKGRYGLFQPHAVERIQALRDRVGGPVNVNSGYRNVTYNAGVGGATWSRHLYGDAIDTWSTSVSLDGLAAHCEALGAGYIGWYETHIHCDWRDDVLDEDLYGPAPPPGPVPDSGDEEGPPLREWRR